MNRARTRLAFLCVIAAGAMCVGAPTAGAHLPGSKMCSSKSPPKVELKCGQRAYYHGLGTVRGLRVLMTRSEQIHTQEAVALRIALYDHLWLMKAGRKWIIEARHRLAPPKPSYASVGHWALWNCIHNGAYPGAPHEGNGYNGQYSGPLQMTSGWGGNPVSDWNTVPLGYVYAAAERQYIASGMSSAWLHGQWPETSPPCSKFEG